MNETVYDTQNISPFALNTTQPVPGGAVAYPGAAAPTTPPAATPTPAAAPTPTPPAWMSDPQFAGMDPALQQIYTNAGQTPAGRGTGFADWQYWQGVGPSQYGRLTNDIAGTGSDQPTGTPWGTGAWSNSGANAGAAGTGTQGSLSAFTVSPFAAPQLSAPLSNPQGTQLYDTLMGIAGQSTNVSPNDPVIKAQSDAYAASTDRATKDYLAAAAEKGGPYGNTDAITRSMTEQAGQAEGAFTANAMASELQARRQQIMQALSGAAGLLTSEQSMQLQSELGNLDAQLSAWSTQQNLAANESQFGRSLAEQAYQFDTTNNNAVFG